MWFLRIIFYYIKYTFFWGIITIIIIYALPDSQANWEYISNFQNEESGTIWLGVFVFLSMITFPLSIIKTIKVGRWERAVEQSKLETLEKRIEELEGKQSPEEENTVRIEKVEKAVKRGFIMSSLMFFVKFIIPFDIFRDDA